MMLCTVTITKMYRVYDELNEQLKNISLQNLLSIQAVKDLKSVEKKYIVQAHTFYSTNDGKMVINAIDNVIVWFNNSMLPNSDTSKTLKRLGYSDDGVQRVLCVYSYMIVKLKYELNIESFFKLYIKKSLINSAGGSAKSSTEESAVSVRNGVFTDSGIDVFKLIDFYPADGIVYSTLENDEENNYFGDGIGKDTEYYSCIKTFKFNNYVVGPVGDKNKSDTYKAHILNTSDSNNCTLWSYRGIHYIFTNRYIESGEELTIGAK